MALLLNVKNQVHMYEHMPLFRLHNSITLHVPKHSLATDETFAILVQQTMDYLVQLLIFIAYTEGEIKRKMYWVYFNCAHKP